MTPEPTTPPGTVLLYWIPVGAGGHVVTHTSRWWETLSALQARRRRQQFVHGALEIFEQGRWHVVEMAPAWQQSDPGRGIIATGPVGLRRLGRWRLFRYEIRWWTNGLIPDRAWAIGAPVVVATDAATGRQERFGGVQLLNPSPSSRITGICRV